MLPWKFYMGAIQLQVRETALELGYRSWLVVGI